MIRIGLLGAQSKHAEIFGSIFNLRSLFPGMRISSLWGGDDPGRIPHLLSELGILTASSTPEELVACCDAVMILTRDGNTHLPWAKAALLSGKPVFVDKPFACTAADAREITETARRTGTPLFGGSTLPHLSAISAIREEILRNAYGHVVIRYAADPESPYGGYHFYGCHLAELAIFLLGPGHTQITAVKNGQNVCAAAVFPQGTAVLLSSPAAQFSVSLFGNDVKHYEIGEVDCYVRGAELFAQMLRNGKPPRDYAYFEEGTALTEEIIRALV